MIVCKKSAKNSGKTSSIGGYVTKKSFHTAFVTIFSVFVGLGLMRPAFASEPQTIDDLGLNEITDDSLFSSGFSLKSDTRLSYGTAGKISNIQTSLEMQSVELDDIDLSDLKPMGDVDNLDNLTSEYQSQGLKIKRLSSSWQNDAGTFTVGSDWANFQDILGIDKEVGEVATSRSVTNQIKWLSPNGFSISLEDTPKDAIFSSGTKLDAGELSSSPSLILSWQGGPGGAAGEYRVSAMGKKLDLSNSGQSFDGTEIMGWGLNLEGGWQIGDLFAVLSVTYGKGINSYVLQRYGNDLLVTPNQLDDSKDVISIRPSLYYSLNNNSNFHVALGHYSTEESSSNAIDTLDTVHMGYSWNPWPSTRLGLELIGKNSNGRDGEVGDTQLTFGAKTRF